MSHTHDVLRRLLHILESGRALNGISNDRATVYAGALREILESPQPAQADANALDHMLSAAGQKELYDRSPSEPAAQADAPAEARSTGSIGTVAIVDGHVSEYKFVSFDAPTGIYGLYIAPAGAGEARLTDEQREAIEYASHGWTRTSAIGTPTPQPKSCAPFSMEPTDERLSRILAVLRRVHSMRYVSLCQGTRHVALAAQDARRKADSKTPSSGSRP
ncbi:hypothetical protein [Burkholderia multivorans]|uniref:hypothetical protein n=1 Tax=Burkholderia multivorans TaxID=87883 RepID=UPI000AAC95C0|nr:hypothetical protein [Burkholderia multivorans]